MEGAKYVIDISSLPTDLIKIILYQLPLHIQGRLMYVCLPPIFIFLTIIDNYLIIFKSISFIFIFYFVIFIFQINDIWYLCAFL